MSFTPTTNYNLQKPNVSTELDTWGDDLNDNWDKTDTQMKLNADAAAAALTAANSKAPASHTHTTAQITGLDTALAGKAATTHTHTTAQVTGLDAALVLKAPLASPTFTGTPDAPTAAGGTNTTQLATTAFVTAAVAAGPGGSFIYADIVTKTATSTLLLTDAGCLVEMNVAGANTLTIPTNASVAFDINTEIHIVQLGAGQTTINGPGVTLRAAGGKLKLVSQYSAATIKKRGTNDWHVWGDLET